MPGKYCVYLRKSRKDIEDESRGAEETLQRHRRALTELAKKLNLPVEKIYPEVVTADSIAARPEMQQLLADVEEGMWEGVLVMEVERLARGETIDQGIVAQAFKYTDTKIITPIKTYDPADEFDEEYFEFGLFMSRREYKSITRRMNRGRIASVNEGRFIGSVPPYGYRKITVDKDCTLAPVPEEAAIVQNIFDWYINGIPHPDGTHTRLGVDLIARRLNDFNVPTRRGGAWVSATVRTLLQNITYTGKVRWNFRKTKKMLVNGEKVLTRPRSSLEDQITAPGLHPAIISDEVFNRVQQILASNRPPPVKKGTGVKNPFAGIMVCGRCGRKMVRRPYSSGQAPSLICSCNACDNVSSELGIVEERLIFVLTEWLRQYEIGVKGITALISTASEHAALERIKAELLECEKQGENLFRLVERGIYSDELFLARRKALDDDMQNLHRKRDEIKAEIAAKDAQNAVASDLLPKVQHVIDAYTAAPTVQLKNEMLKEILEKVIYTRTSGGRWHKDKYNFTLEIFPKWPKAGQ